MVECAIHGWSIKDHVYERDDGAVRVNVWHDASEPRPFRVRKLSPRQVWVEQRGRFKTATGAMKRWSH